MTASAYLHIPFCYHKCGYCDFASVAGAEDRMEEYLVALEKEIVSILDGPAAVATIFVGGGTPTYLPPPLLERFIHIIRRWFTPLAGCAFEFTVEANPNTLTAEKVAILAAGGVNRVSLGAQSFEPEHLKTLERDHDPDSVARAVELLRPVIGNFSIDLIFGVPGQTMDQWRRDLARAMDLAPNHCSTYGLTYEKGTRLWKQKELAIVTPIDEEIERSMYEHSMDALAAGGYQQYEISNFARHGADAAATAANACRHNLAYWANDSYYGFGTGAAAYVNGVRTLNTRELNSYIERANRRVSPITQSEKLVGLDHAHETAMLNLRRTTGLDRDEFLQRTGFAFDTIVGTRFAKVRDLGLVDDDGRRIKLSRSGLFVADAVFQSLW